jgi:hypothetical protein
MNTPLLRLCAVLAAGIPVKSPAATIAWTGGTANWDTSNARWNPADEPDADDTAVFNTAHVVTMTNASDTVLGLTMSGGIDLLTNGNDLTVDGLVQLTDASTLLSIDGSTSLLRADSMAINTGGTVRLMGGTLTIIEETDSGLLSVNTGGMLSGNGTINLNDGAAAGTTLMRLSGGSLVATSNTPGDTAGADAATLTIDMSDTDSRIDLDNNSSSVGIGRNDTLVINAMTHQASDPYGGTLNLAEGATLSMEQPWEIDTGIINANTGGLVAGTRGNPATITGGALTFTGGTINLDAVDSLRISAPITAATGGTISNAGNLIIDVPLSTTFGPDVDFQMTGPDASLTITLGAGGEPTEVSVIIEDDDLNLDGSGTATNVLTIGDGAGLALFLGAGADTTLGGTINLSGSLSLDTDTGKWGISRALNVPANDGSAFLGGDEVNFAGATVTVGANTRLEVFCSSVWTASTQLVTGPGTIVKLGRSNSATFSGGSYTGSGALYFGRETTFAAATTIDMPMGIVELDGQEVATHGNSAGNLVAINDDVTINAGTLGNFGYPYSFATDTLNIAANAVLTVNLTDPGAEWTLTADSLLNINTIGPTVASAGIAGSDFNLNGAASILGHGVFSARADIAGAVSVSSGSSLSLNGGTLTELNRLIGGSIVGEGALRSLVDTGLAGFGTIATDIEFAGNTVLLADDGMLTVDAPIADVGIIGTAAADGILNVSDPWNTNVAGEVKLLGGELRGALITNAGAGGISGFGLLSAPVTNTSFIGAEGGPLVVQTSGNNNDWDGAGSGQLRAILGHLEIRDNASFPFAGDVVARQDYEVFANGFELEFEPSSRLVLESGTFHSTNTTDFGGTMTVAVPVGSVSLLRVAGTWTFENGSFTTLNGNLLLDNTLTVVQFGADINGSGALINAVGRQLRLLVGTHLLAPVINRGQLQLGINSVDGQVQGKDYQQTATGAWGVDIGGIGMTDIDSFTLTGTASLSGALNVSLIGGFVPAAGQTFTILTAPGGVSGAFTSVTQPPSMPAGLSFSVSYSPTSVTLTVLTSIESWIEQFGLTAPADKLIGANPDGDDLNNLGEFALDGNPANGLNTGKVSSKIAAIDGVPVLTLTLPVRLGTAPDPADPAGGELALRQAAEAVGYKIQAFSSLTSGPLTVTEVTGPHVLVIHSALPGLNPGWQYRTFRSPGPVAGAPREFLRAVISE